ncbi:putative reverse transcriptase domain-containing protein [Tanacetum coccineum]
MRQRRWIELFSDFDSEIRYHLRKANDKILAAPGEASKVENATAEMLCGLDQLMERKEDESLYFMVRIWVPLVRGVRTIIMDEAQKTKYSLHPGADKMYHDLRDMYWWPGMKRDIATYVSKCLTCSKVKAEHQRPSGKSQSGEESQKSYADNRRKQLEFEVGDRVLLKVSHWKAMIHFGKKGKLAPRYVGPFKILERIGHVAYRLRLLEELSGVHNTFYVLNLKKCLADANLHVPLNEIKVDKTLRFVETLMAPSSLGDIEDHMKSKYPLLFVDRTVEPAS